MLETVIPAPDTEPTDLFRLSFEKAAVGMTLVSSDYRFLRANASFCRMLGLQEEELLERGIFDLGYAEERGDTSGWAHGLEPDQDSFHLDARFEHRSGAAVCVHLSVS